MHSSNRFRSPVAQRGAAAVGIAILGLFLVAGAVTTILSLTTSIVRDAEAAEQQAQALFLAESGLEFATRQFVINGACSTLVDNVSYTVGTTGTFQIISASSVSTDFNGNSLTSTSCRVQARGTVTSGNVARVIESIIVPNIKTSSNKTPGGSTNKKLSFTTDVVAGNDLLYVLAFQWTGSTSVTVSGVTFNSTQPMTPVNGKQNASGPITTTTGSGSSTTYYSAQMFYLANPANGVPGTYTVEVSLSGDVNGTVVTNYHFAGVQQSNPIDNYDGKTASCTASSATSINVGLTTSSSNSSSFVIDNLVREKGSSLSPAGLARSAEFETSGNNTSGGTSYTGSIAASTTVNLGWVVSSGTKSCALTAVALRASSATGSGSKVRLPGGSVQYWREVIVRPS